MGTKPFLHLGLALLLLSAPTAGLTWGLEGGERIPPAPRLHGTFRNLDPGFWSASNWTRVRFYLLGLSAMLNRRRPVSESDRRFFRAHAGGTVGADAPDR